VEYCSTTPSIFLNNEDHAIVIRTKNCSSDTFLQQRANTIPSNKIWCQFGAGHSAANSRAFHGTFQHIGPSDHLCSLLGILATGGSLPGCGIKTILERRFIVVDGMKHGGSGRKAAGTVSFGRRHFFFCFHFLKNSKYFCISADR